MFQKGISAIIILIILSSIISAAVLINKNKIPKKADNVGSKQENTLKTVTSTPTPTTSITSSPKPQSTLKPSPTYFYSPTPTPTQTPVPTPKQPILTTKVYLGRSHSSMPESAIGDGEIKLMGINPYMSDNAKIASLQYNFNLKALEAEREYLIYICTIQEGGDCIGLGNFKTDKSGNAGYSDNSGITITKDRPFKAIKIVHLNGGFCSNSGSPCLRGELSLEIKF